MDELVKLVGTKLKRWHDTAIAPGPRTFHFEISSISGTPVVYQVVGCVGFFHI
jgi:hypothetical protein